MCVILLLDLLLSLGLALILTLIIVTNSSAIGIHKGFTAYALASSLIASGYWSDKSKRKYFYASTGLFIGLTLIGIAIGWGISTATSEDSLVSAILIACTAGSFLYVSAIEIIPEEMDIIKQQKLKTPLIILCFLMGYCLMTILAIWV
jgi:zinc transporter ZupT